MFRSISGVPSVATAIVVLASATVGATAPGAVESRNDGTTASQRSFGPVKQINAGLLSVGYVEAGPANGASVILLHGWPYDIYSFVDVVPILTSAGYHVFVPVFARVWQHAVSFG